MKKFQITSVIILILITILALALSYKDQRPADGNLEVGFPFVFYLQTAGFGAPPSTEFDILGLFGNLFVYAAVSVTIAYLVFRN